MKYLSGATKFLKIVDILKRKGYKFLSEGGISDIFINRKKKIIIEVYYSGEVRIFTMLNKTHSKNIKELRMIKERTKDNQEDFIIWKEVKDG